MRPGSIREDDRGLSKVIGTALLVSFVFVGAMATLFVGAQALDQASSQQRAAAAEASLQQAARTLTSLAGGSGSSRAPLDLSGDVGDEMELVERGELEIVVNQGSPSSCTATVPLSSLRFEQSGRTIAYEAGGVWRAARRNGSTMVSPPTLGFRDGTLEVTVLNLTGTVDQDANVAEYREEASLSRSNDLEINLTSAPCQDPGNISVTVQSDFYHAWGEYFQSSLDVGTADIFHGNETARLFISEANFPTRLDNERNRAINLSHAPTAPYMNDVDVPTGGRSITVNKTRFNGSSVGPFPATLVPLDRSEPPAVGTLKTMTTDNTTRVVRPPVDVVFVMDISDSMSYTNVEDAKDALNNSVGVLNTSFIGDRAGIVYYSGDANYMFPNGTYFSGNPDELNATADELTAPWAQLTPNTDLAGALNHSIAQLDTARDERHDGNILLMTDGKNEPSETECGYYGYDVSNNSNLQDDCNAHFDDRTLNAAHIAEERGYTVYTFGFSSSANETLLSDVADITGGEYFFASDGTELEENFANVTRQITVTQAYMTRTPLSTNVSIENGQVLVPEMPGDVGDIAAYNQSDNTFLNVNDPAAPSLFRHGSLVDNGQTVRFNATVYDCDQWESTGSLIEQNGTTYPVARCGNITATNRSLDATDITVHTNWKNSNATSLRQTDAVNETLEPFVGDDGTFALGSNQAVVRLDFEPQGDAENDMFLLYQIGVAESSVQTADVVDVEVGRVEIGS
jgi:hypothetical protein